MKRKRSNKIPPPRISFKEFCEMSSINSFKYLQEQHKGVLHILFWSFFNLGFIVSTAFLISILWGTLKETPTVVSLESSNYPISKVAFPAISVCNINKMSKKKTVEMARYISEKTNTSFKIISDYIGVLSSLYDYDDTSSGKLIEFQKIIEMYADLEEFRTTNLMKTLAPSCEEFLLNCSWKGQNVNCSHIFKMRLTFEGYCCVFNYVKATFEIAKEDVPKRVRKGKPGLYNGLTVVINNQLDDYYYSRHASFGANVHVFYPYDYPDKNSGSLSEILVGIGTEVLMEIGILSFHTVKEVITHPIEKRRCYFFSERITPFGFYSESDCFLNCRMKSMLALCGCVPFTIPVPDQNLVCGLSDIECLHKYRLKWKSLAPHTDLIDEDGSLLKETQYSLNCEECYPACDTLQYIVNLNPVPLRDPSFGNNSVLRIFYRNRYSTLYKQDVVYYWFDVLSSFGGAFGLTIGFSVISAIEIIIFLVYKVIKHVQDILDIWALQNN